MRIMRVALLLSIGMSVPTGTWLPSARAWQGTAGEERAFTEQVEEEEAEAQTETPEPPPGLLGHWLHGSGWLTLEYVYTGEVFTNMRGGLNTNRATEYQGLFDLSLAADLEQLDVIPGATFFLFGQNSHGRGITVDHVGDLQFLSNIDSLPFTQVSEYFWEQRLCDGSLRVLLGKQDANVDFAVVEPAGEFINSSFGFHPNIPMPTYPDPSMAAVVDYHLNENVRLQYGVWDGRPDGRNWGFSGSGVTFHMWELELRHALGRRGQLPGGIHLGPWYHSDQWDDLAPDSTRVFSGNYGFHVEGDQMLWKESWTDDKDDQGLCAFAQYGWAPADRNLIEHYIGGGMIYRGPLRRRDDDVVGAGVAHIILSDRLPRMTYETAIELFYKAQVSPYIMFQPDLQFIANPGGNGRDAFAFGLRFEVVL